MMSHCLKLFFRLTSALRSGASVVSSSFAMNLTGVKRGKM